MGKITVLDETTKNPITLIGQRAGVCWGADTSDPIKNYKRGLDCLESNHGRTLEYPNIEIVIEGCCNGEIPHVTGIPGCTALPVVGVI